MPFRRLAAGVLDLFLPPTCICCGRSADPSDDPRRVCLCPVCRDEIVTLTRQPACPRCGHGLGPHAACPACRDDPPPFHEAVRVGAYDGPLGLLIRRIKYQGVRPPSLYLADLLADRLRSAGIADRVDLVAPVPLHWWRCYRRGFNQASLLARGLKERGLPAPLERVLARVRDTPPQVGLSRTARRENVRGAFRTLRPRRVRGRRVLLVDDVMTTGATAGACAAELLRAGARSVAVAVVAVAGAAHQDMASRPDLL